MCDARKGNTITNITLTLLVLSSGRGFKSSKDRKFFFDLGKFKQTSFTGLQVATSLMKEKAILLCRTRVTSAFRYL